MTSARVLCVGILVADVFVPPLARLPDAGELVATDDFLIQPGGCAANVALALDALGVPSAVCGRVGDDLLGRAVELDLRERGVDTSGILVAPDYGTSKTVILPVIGEDRRYVHTFGANAALTVQDIDPAALRVCPRRLPRRVSDPPALTARERADVVPRRGSCARRGVVLDVAAPAGHEASLADLSARSSSQPDFFVPNVDEARVLTGEVDHAARPTACSSTARRTS